jgi:hypothetical protein
VPWHKFIEGKSYHRDYVVAECEKRINSGAIKNKPNAQAWLEDISMCPYEMLVWHPFGTTSHGRSPLNWRAWRTLTGEPICKDHIVPWKE